MFNSIRIKNKILQTFYRPRLSRGIFSSFSLTSQTLSFFDEIEDSIEKNITPLLSEFF
jgi:hypothetical protein